MSEAAPLLSIVVPTRDRESQLRACLEAMTRLQDLPLSEVIVVDDGSLSPPSAAVEQYRHRLDVRLIVQPHRGVGAARNTGAEAARGKYLLFTSDDCLPSSDWLRTLAARLNDEPPGTALGGSIRNGRPHNVFSEASHMLVEYMCFGGDGSPRQRFFTPNNLAVPADLFRAAGGFDPDFSISAGEDRDFCARWVERGLRLAYCPAAEVVHHHPLSFLSFLRTHWNYGRGSGRFRRTQAARWTSGVSLEPPGYYLRLLTYPIRKRGARALPHTVLLALTQIAAGAGLVFELIRRPSLRTRSDVPLKSPPEQALAGERRRH